MDDNYTFNMLRIAGYILEPKMNTKSFDGEMDDTATLSLSVEEAI